MVDRMDDLFTHTMQPGDYELMVEEKTDEYEEYASKMKENMQHIHDRVGWMERTLGERMTATGKAEARKQNEMQMLLNACNSEMNATINHIKRMEARLKRECGNPPTSIERGRMNMHANVKHQFRQALSAFQNIQQRTINACEGRMRREVQVTRPDLTPEQVEHIVTNNDPATVFRDEFLGTLDAQQNLLFIAERHNDILRLEQSLRQLHQLFADMAMLVFAQGENVDRIGYSIQSTVTYTGEALEELDGAIQAQGVGRRKKWIIASLVIALLAIIIVPIVITQVRK